MYRFVTVRDGARPPLEPTVHNILITSLLLTALPQPSV